MLFPKLILFLFPLLGPASAPSEPPPGGSPTDILEAARTGQLEVVARLLDESEDAVRCHDERNSTALHFAATGGHLEVAELLLEAGAELEARDVDGDTPLMWAAHAGHVEVAGLLYDAGADPTAENQAKRTLLHYAILSGNRETIELALSAELDVDARDYEGNTALHLAVLRNRLDLAKLLLEAGADTEQQDNYGRTPLLLVARESGDLALARFLIDQGADLEARDRFGATSLNLSAWRGYGVIVDLLIERGAEVPAAGRESQTLTIFAANRGLARLFPLLVEKGADLSLRSEEGGSLLHAASAGGSAEIVKLLLEEGLPIGERDRYGRTPLHYAAERGRLEVVKLLLEQKADPNAASLSGITPYDDARLADRKRIAELLQEAGAEGGEPRFPTLTGPYFGQEPPGLEPELFAPDIVSSHRFEHGSVTFSPDGTEAFWSSSFQLGDAGYTTSRLFTAGRREGRWILPGRPAFAADVRIGDDVPCFAPDGKRLYFISRRPAPGQGGGGERIWYADRTKDGWSAPLLIPGGPNAIGLHWQFSVAENGAIYFGSSAAGGRGMGDLYRCALEGDTWTPPVNLGAPINGEGSEGSPFIAPDESYLLLVRNGHPGGIGGADLFISFREPDGGWREPVILPPPLNTPSNEQCPTVSRDGKYLFFNSHRAGNADVYWVDARVIEPLRPG